MEKVVWNLYFESLQLNFEAEEITDLFTKEVKNKDWGFDRQNHRICRSLLNVVYTEIILYKINTSAFVKIFGPLLPFPY